MNATRVLGVDPSLRSSGFSYRSAQKLVMGRIETGDLRHSYRLFYVRKRFHEILDASQPELLVIEDYAMGAARGKRNNNTFHIGELVGVLKLAAWERGIDCLPVAPTSMKSVIALNGRAEKKDIICTLQKSFGIAVSHHDEADAVGLMLVGEMRTGLHTSHVNEGRIERIKSVMDVEIIKGKLQSISDLTR